MASMLVVAVAMLIAIAGCGGGGSPDASAGDSAESGIPDSTPKLEVPPGLPPKKLVVKDLSKGTGTKAKKGDEVALHYYCINWGSGAEYANSWLYSSVPTFVLGERIRLLRGLNVAVPGMKEGGGREVLIPNNLIYYPGVSHIPTARLDSLICQVYLVDVLGQKKD